MSKQYITLQELFYEAASNGDLNSCKRILTEDSMLLWKTELKTGRLALHFAAIGNPSNADVIRYLANKHERFNPNQQDREGYSPLMLALQSGFVENAKALLECEKVDINQYLTLATKEHPIHCAARSGSPAAVELVLKHSPKSIQILDYQGFSPILTAAQQGHLNVVKFLEANGASHYDTALYAGTQTALHIATVTASSEALELINYLIDEKKIQVESTTDDFYHSVTPLLTACRNANYAAYNVLLNTHGASFAIDTIGNTALHYAAASGCVDIVKDILSRNVINVEATNVHGFTPFLSAAIHGKFEVMQLLSSTAKVNTQVKDNIGNTALHYAACHNTWPYNDSAKVVQWLIDECGLSVDLKNNDGQNVISFAQNCMSPAVRTYLKLEKDDMPHYVHRHDITKMLLSRFKLNCDPSRTPFHCLEKPLDIDHVAYFKQHEKAFERYNINQRDATHSNTPLGYAIRRGDVDLVKYFIQKCDADVNAWTQYHASTPIGWAVHMGNVAMVQYLLSVNGLEIQGSGDGNRAETPLWIAAANGDVTMAQLLIDAKAPVVPIGDEAKTIRDYPDTNILHFAAQAKNGVAILKWIKQHPEVPQDINAQAWQDFTPLALACEAGCVENVKFLIDEMNANPDVWLGHNSNLISLAESSQNQATLEYVKSIPNILEFCKTPEQRRRDAWENRVSPRQLYIGEYILQFQPGTPSPEYDGGNETVPIEVKAANFGFVHKLNGLYYNPDLDALDRNGLTKICAAAKLGQSGPVRQLLKKFANPTTKCGDEDNAPIHWAAAAPKNNMEMLDVLTEDPNVKLDVKNGAGETPLLFATKMGSVQGVKALLRRNVNHEDVNNEGKGIAELAAESGSEKMITFITAFLNGEIDLDEEDIEEETNASGAGKVKPAPLSKEERDALKAQKAKELAAKKEAQAAEKAAKKAEMDAAKAESAALKADAAAAKKAEMEAAKAAKKAEMEAEKAAKKAEMEAAKAAKKAELEAAKAAKAKK